MSSPHVGSESFRLKLEGLGWLAAWRLARALPERVTVAGFQRLSARSFRRNAVQRARVIGNLTPVVGAERAPDVAREAFRSYGKYWAETFRMQDLSSDELNARLRWDGLAHLAGAYEAGTGGVFAVPHIGNWDAGGRAVSERFPFTVAAEVLRPKMLFDRFIAHRRSLGMEIIPVERGSDVTSRCVDAVARGNLLALVADRDLSGRGIPVTMFGHPTKLPPGPAVIALRSRAPLMSAAVFQCEDGGWLAVINPPLARPADDDPDPVGTLTRALAAEFEELIARAPEQWHVFSRYWLDDGATPSGEPGGAGA